MIAGGDNKEDWYKKFTHDPKKFILAMISKLTGKRFLLCV